MKYKIIVFDLDGTLIDTSIGIFNSVRYAEKMMNLSKIPDSKLKEFIGPPPKIKYMELYGLDNQLAEIATRYHRQYGKEKGFLEAELYKGVKDTLKLLNNYNYSLVVATLKSQSIAEKILKHFSIIHFFDKIVGMDSEEQLTKSDTIRLAISNHNICSNALMVGDSYYDLIGSKEANVDFLAVQYGFGFDGAISDINCIGNINSISELIYYI